MFRSWQKWQDRKRLAARDATILIARCGARASYIANRRLTQMIFKPSSLSLEARSFDYPSITAI
jgi:hypothetical protein